jgi:hypothetical protein
MGGMVMGGRDLSHNDLEGSIPPELGQLVELNFL